MIAANVNIVINEDLRSLILGGPKLREPTSFTWCRNFIHIMNPVEDYAMRWVKFGKEDPNTMSECVKCIRCISKTRIKRLRGHMKTIYLSVFNKAEVRKELDRLHDQYVLDWYLLTKHVITLTLSLFVRHIIFIAF